MQSCSAEDPFDVDVDLGRYVDEETVKDIVQVVRARALTRT